MLRLIKPEAIRDFANGDKTEIIDEEFVKAYADAGGFGIGRQKVSGIYKTECLEHLGISVPSTL